MQTEGLHPDQICQVRGFADQRPRLPQNPEDPSNRRISVIVQYQVIDATEAIPPQIKSVQQDKEVAARSSGLEETMLLRR